MDGKFVVEYFISLHSALQQYMPLVTSTMINLFARRGGSCIEMFVVQYEKRFLCLAVV